MPNRQLYSPLQSKAHLILFIFSQKTIRRFSALHLVVVKSFSSLTFAVLCRNVRSVSCDVIAVDPWGRVISGHYLPDRLQANCCQKGPTSSTSLSLWFSHSALHPLVGSFCWSLQCNVMCLRLLTCPLIPIAPLFLINSLIISTQKLNWNINLH